MYMNDFKNLNVSEFWIKVSQIKCADESAMFPTLSNFILDIMCLPHQVQL
jgi:hypothetical protein